MNIINSTPRRVHNYRKELWSWNKNQNVALEQMKAATMVLNMVDYAIYIYQVSSQTLTCHSIAKGYYQ